MKVDLGNVTKIVENLLSTYWEVGKHWRKKLEPLSAIASCDSYASLVLSNLPRASMTRQTHAHHQTTVQWHVYLK